MLTIYTNTAGPNGLTRAIGPTGGIGLVGGRRNPSLPFFLTGSVVRATDPEA